MSAASRSGSSNRRRQPLSTQLVQWRVSAIARALSLSLWSCVNHLSQLPAQSMMGYHSFSIVYKTRFLLEFYKYLYKQFRKLKNATLDCSRITTSLQKKKQELYSFEKLCSFSKPSRSQRTPSSIILIGASQLSSKPAMGSPYSSGLPTSVVGRQQLGMFFELQANTNSGLYNFHGDALQLAAIVVLSGIIGFPLFHFSLTPYTIIELVERPRPDFSFKRSVCPPASSWMKEEEEEEESEIEKNARPSLRRSRFPQIFCAANVRQMSARRRLGFLQILT